MVWRRVADPHDPRSTSQAHGTAAHAGVALDRFRAGAAVSNASGANAAATPAAPPERGNQGLDLERVVDEVTRRIVGQGLIQRERRGGL
jgi:hypothetical protein